MQLDANQAKQLLQNIFAPQLANLQLEKTNPSFEQYTITFDLSVAKDRNDPFPISFPFRQVVARDATDNASYIYLLPGSRDSIQGSSKLLKRDTWDSGDFQAPQGYLYWDAQPGKSITLEFHLKSRYTPGNVQVSTTVTEGSGVTSSAKATVGVASAILLAADSTRVVACIQNQGGVSIYVGDVNVTLPSGGFPGIEIPVGGFFYFKNTGVLYAVAASSNPSIAVLTER